VDAKLWIRLVPTLDAVVLHHCNNLICVKHVFRELVSGLWLIQRELIQNVSSWNYVCLAALSVNKLYLVSVWTCISVDLLECFQLQDCPWLWRDYSLLSYLLPHLISAVCMPRPLRVWQLLPGCLTKTAPQKTLILVTSEHSERPFSWKASPQTFAV